MRMNEKAIEAAQWSGKWDDRVEKSMSYVAPLNDELRDRISLDLDRVNVLKDPECRKVFFDALAYEIQLFRERTSYEEMAFSPSLIAEEFGKAAASGRKFLKHLYALEWKGLGPAASMIHHNLLGLTKEFRGFEILLDEVEGSRVLFESMSSQKGRPRAHAKKQLARRIALLLMDADVVPTTTENALFGEILHTVFLELAGRDLGGTISVKDYLQYAIRDPES